MRIWVERYIPVTLSTEHIILSCHPHLQLCPINHLISGNRFSTLLSLLHALNTLIILNYFLFSNHAKHSSLQAFEHAGPLLGAHKRCTPTPPHRKLPLLQDSGLMQPSLICSLMPQSALVALYKPFLCHLLQQKLRVQPLGSERFEFESWWCNLCNCSNQPARWPPVVPTLWHS